MKDEPERRVQTFVFIGQRSTAKGLRYAYLAIDEDQLDRVKFVIGVTKEDFDAGSPYPDEAVVVKKSFLVEQPGQDAGAPRLADSSAKSLVWKKRLTSGNAGKVFTCEVSLDGHSAFVGSDVFLGFWGHPKQVADWQRDSTNAYRQQCLEGLRRRAEKVNLPFDLLDPWRHAYRKATPQNRSTLLAAVIDYVMSGV